MNRFIYLITIVLFCIGFSACEKEETAELIDFEKRQKSREAFFKSSKTKSADDFTIQIKDFLKYIDDRTHFTEEFVETYGRPWWDICKTTYSGNTALRIVPIIDTDEIHLSGLQFFGYRNNKFVSFFILNDECAIKTLKNDQMRTLYSNLILNYERVLSKQRLKEVRVVGNGNCYSTFVDALWIKTECRLTVADWEPNGPTGPNPNGPEDPNEAGGSGGSESIGGGTSGNGGPGSGGSIPECNYVDGKCHIIGWLKPIEVPEELIPKPLQYPHGSEYAKIYPKLTEYLKNQISKVISNKRIMEALKGYGQFTDEQIKENLNWGNGPIITILDIKQNFNKDAYGLFSFKTPDRIYLDINLVNKMENALGINSEALLFLVAVTILHETVHLGDFNFDGVKFEFEAGNAFEKYVYGEMINEGNDQKHIKLWLTK